MTGLASVHAMSVDRRVISVGDGLVARFGEDTEREAALLQAIAPRLPLPVPVPVAVEHDHLVYPRVPGVALLHVPRAARRVFEPQLRAFADAVHALDPGVDVPVDHTPLSDWLEEARDTWPAVRDAVAAKRHAAIETCLTRTPSSAVRRTFIHGDLGAEHVFAADGRITGVIDWSDAAIGDPALDHGRLLRDFGGPAGARARLYAICTAIEDLAYPDERYRRNALAALEELAAPTS